MCVRGAGGGEEFSLPYLPSSSLPGQFRGSPHGSFHNTLPTVSAYAQKRDIKTAGTTVIAVMQHLESATFISQVVGQMLPGQAEEKCLPLAQLPKDKVSA